MQGFLITNAINPLMHNYDFDKDSNCKFLKWKNYQFFFSPLKKFDNDKLFFEDNDCIIILDGVVLNKNELELQFGITDLSSLSKKMFNYYGETFFSNFRGSFSGCFVDKIKENIYMD